MVARIAQAAGVERAKVLRQEYNGCISEEATMEEQDWEVQ